MILFTMNGKWVCYKGMPQQCLKTIPVENIKELHSIFHSDRYVEKSQFIAEINNEPPYNNTEYVENLKNLENFVMAKFTEVKFYF